MLEQYQFTPLNHRAHENVVDASIGQLRSTDITEYDSALWLGSAWTYRDNVGFDQEIDWVILDEQDKCFNLKGKIVITQKHKWIINPYQGLEIVRLTALKAGVLKLRQSEAIIQPVTESVYSIYRYRNFFKWISYLAAFSSTLKRKDDLMLRKYLRSLSNRLHQWCQALDEVMKYAKEVHKDVDFHKVEYHFNYLILLTSGIIDNLAWLANLIFRVNESNKTKIGLRKGKLAGDFIKMLAHKKPSFSILIDKNQDLIGIISEIRHAIMHRDLSQGHSANDEVFLQLPEEAKVPLLRQNPERWGLLSGLLAEGYPNTINVHQFSRNLTIEFRKFGNAVMSSLAAHVIRIWTPRADWHEIKRSAQAIKYAYFQWGDKPTKPYYFCNED